MNLNHLKSTIIKLDPYLIQRELMENKKTIMKMNSTKKILIHSIFLIIHDIIRNITQKKKIQLHHKIALVQSLTTKNSPWTTRRTTS